MARNEPIEVAVWPDCAGADVICGMMFEVAATLMLLGMLTRHGNGMLALVENPEELQVAAAAVVVMVLSVQLMLPNIGVEAHVLIIDEIGVICGAIAVALLKSGLIALSPVEGDLKVAVSVKALAVVGWTTLMTPPESAGLLDNPIGAEMMLGSLAAYTGREFRTRPDVNIAMNAATNARATMAKRLRLLRFK